MATEQIQTTIHDWISKFQAYLSSLTLGQRPDLTDLLFPDAAWRDLIAFDWDFHTIYGLDNIHKYLMDTDGQNKLHKNEFKCFGELKAVKEVQAGPGFSWIQAIFPFETKVGKGRGVVRLIHDPLTNSWKAKTISTGLEGLKGQDEPILSKRAYGYANGTVENRQTWKELRELDVKFENREPEVLIIGSGHGGLILGARLKMQGVDALIIEKNARVGDNWRNRYDCLKLHDPVWMDHMPYMPFPESWPVFPPKDKMGDWLETYAQTLELNVWTSTLLSESAKYDDASGIWTVNVTTSDKKISEDGKPIKRALKPKHVVLATGHSGDPRILEFKNRESFEGEVMHSCEFKSGKEFKGKKVVVIGACTSAIDIAQDLYEQGALPTLVQRSSTYVISTPTFLNYMVQGMYGNGEGLPDEGDVNMSGTPWKFGLPLAEGLAGYMAQIDKDMLEGLNKVGFKTNLGVDNIGIGSSYLNRGGGYYIDVGACDLIINGQIKVKQGSEIAAFKKGGLELSDGSSLEADAIVMATGWGDFQPYAEKILGPEAKRMGPVWGLDAEGELRGNWRPTQHPALWNMLGPMNMSRCYSKMLAVQLKARLTGIAPFQSG